MHLKTLLSFRGGGGGGLWRIPFDRQLGREAGRHSDMCLAFLKVFHTWYLEICDSRFSMSVCTGEARLWL